MTKIDHNASPIDKREDARFSKGEILWLEGRNEREKKKERWKRAVVRSWQRFASARITTRKNGEGTIPINLSVSQKETMFPLSFRGAAMRRNRNYTRNHPWLPREDPGLLTTFALAIFYTSNSLPRCIYSSGRFCRPVRRNANLFSRNLDPSRSFVDLGRS